MNISFFNSIYSYDINFTKIRIDINLNKNFESLYEKTSFFLTFFNFRRSTGFAKKNFIPIFGGFTRFRSQRSQKYVFRKYRSVTL